MRFTMQPESQTAGTFLIEYRWYLSYVSSEWRSPGTQPLTLSQSCAGISVSRDQQRNEYLHKPCTSDLACQLLKMLQYLPHPLKFSLRWMYSGNSAHLRERATSDCSICGIINPALTLKLSEANINQSELLTKATSNTSLDLAWMYIVHTYVGNL